jgi:D-beta-D-heptose 7-phosphate kinase/D-beta-D-heptose 1-phosphate adenosyltransferase
MSENKIKNIKDLELIVSSLKKKNKTIGFTNGCFDILHAGHISYLENAKDKCDILIVAINSDSSVKQIKGEKRPLVSELDRMKVVASLEPVDYVVKFNESTPLNLIKKIKPDVLIKGGDWQQEDIVGSSFVKQHGGKVITVPFVKGYSTSFIIESIISRFGKNVK